MDPRFLGPIYPGIATIQLEPGPMTGSMGSVATGGLSISSGQLSRTVLFEGRFSEDTINIGFVLSGNGGVVAHGRSVDVGIITIDCDNAVIHEVMPANVAWVEISGPRSILSRYVRPAEEYLRKSGHAALAGPRNQILPLIELVKQCFLDAGHDDIDSFRTLCRLLLEQAERVLAARMTDIDTYSSDIEGDRFRTHVLKAAHQLDTEPTTSAPALDQICRATGMKRRTLQKYFREIYGMGPTKYFRARRLNAARAALMSSVTPLPNVTAAAEQHGFSHLGRFAMYYKRLFGESPSQTAQCRATSG